MSASTPQMSSFQTVLADFLGGGLSVSNKSGKGFSTVYDPSTGSYKTTIDTGNTQVVAAGAAQSPLGFFSGLGQTTGSRILLFGVVALIAVLAIGALMRRG